MPRSSAVPKSVALLFRYLALTGNSYRIHHDMDHAWEVEGYPGLVVHGPWRLEAWPDGDGARLRTLDSGGHACMEAGPPLPSLLATPHALRDNAKETVRGILVVAVAYVFLTASDVAAKWALSSGVAAVMLGRGLAGSLTVVVLARVEGDMRRLLPVRWGLVLARSVLHSGVSVSWYLAWQVVPLADGYAVGFAAPLLMTVLAVPMLGERIHWRRTLSTLLGFSGVLVMVQPGSALWHPVILVLLPGVVGIAISRIMTRQLSTTETAECLTFWLMLAHIPAGLVMLGAGFPGMGAADWNVWFALGMVGVLNATAHWLMARAYALAPVSALSPYEYTMLAWGGLAGWVIFHEVPGWRTLAGAGIVAAAGLYNLHRERVRRGGV